MFLLLSQNTSDSQDQSVPCYNAYRRKCIYVNAGKQEESSYVTITSGCPADHVSGFRNGGLKKMLSECKIRYRKEKNALLMVVLNTVLCTLARASYTYGEKQSLH